MIDRRMALAGGAAALAGAIAVPAAAASEGVVSRVDHISMACPDAEPLFKLMTGAFDLPVAFPYARYGLGVGSGGVYIGNMAIEIAQAPGAPPHARASVLVFAPARSADASLAEMERRGLAHGDLIPIRGGPGPDAPLTWVLLDARNMGAQGLRVVLCDYRIDTKTPAVAGAKKLGETHGGPLGLIKAREVVIGVRDLPTARTRWRALLTPIAERGDRFVPSEGPPVRLKAADQDAFQALVIEVRSLSQARRALAAQGIAVAERDGGLDLGPGMQGLPVSLVQA